MNGTCDGCGKSSWLIPLHGDEGGPLRCFLCAGEWHAKHTRRRKWGRIVIKAMKVFLREGGRWRDLDKLKMYVSPLSGVLAGIEGKLMPGYEDTIGADVGDITSELLADAIALVHPDKHPPERQELAKRVTQELLALKPFVFPAPKPQPVAPTTPPPERDDSVIPAAAGLIYPCQRCADQTPYFYCKPCKAEWNKRRDVERERDRAKQRKWYAQRKAARWKIRACDACGANFKGKREDARFCSDKCRQKAHRAAVTNNSRLRQGTLTSRDDRWQRGVLALLDRHPAVFLNDLLPKKRTRAEYQALCLAVAKLEAAGKVASISWWTRCGKPGFKALVKPGHNIESSDQIPRLKSDERFQC